MTGGPIRHIVPVAYMDSSLWPTPDISHLDRTQANEFHAKKEAVEMYLADYSFKDIKARCGYSENEIRRFLRRCITSDGGGSIYGFYALLPRFRVKVYTRSAPVLHFASADKGGCAGALSQLLEAHPDVVQELQDLFFRKAGAKEVQEARISFAGVHNDFIKLLRKKGFCESEWPFNTKTYGYVSIRNYCKNLWEQRAQYGMSSRAGDDAARRHGVGEGKAPLIPLIRPYSYVQLDFHKIDAASIIVFKNSFDEEIEVPVSRWHIGLLAEERSKAILGCYVSLEMTPSGDCVLETVESALIPETLEATDPRCSLVSDGKIVINQLIPELGFQGFSALKIDNAWSNASTEVVNKIIDTVGCAVNFGPVKAWWRRSLIEGIFGELTRHGLQRMPSTYGSGPADSRKSNPNEKAIKFRILISELISIIAAEVRRHNELWTEGLQGSSPLSAIKSAMAHPATGFLQTRLPVRTQRSLNLMTHEVECTVRGNIKKNIRPYFKVDRSTHTNELLSRSYHLVGKKIIVHINRRDVRDVHAIVKETGEHLGAMLVERRWRQTKCSWRARKMINRCTLSRRLTDESSDAVATWGKNKKKELFEQRSRANRKTRSKSSSVALAVARILKEDGNSDGVNKEHTPVNQTAVSVHMPVALPPNPFGIGDLPTLSQLKGI